MTTVDLRTHAPAENYLVADSVSQALRWLQAGGYEQVDGNVMVWARSDERVRLIEATERLRGCRRGAKVYMLGSWWRRSDNHVLASIIDQRELVREEIA